MTAGSYAACPAPVDIKEEESRLLDTVQKADNPADGQNVTKQLWKLWTKAPNEQAQTLLDKGMSARSSYDFLAAMDAFDRLTSYCPDYAEGYNQRAFVSFLRQDFSKAIEDLDLALERNPRHVGALSGKSLTLMALGQNEEAQKILKQALDLNPWIPERGLLQTKKGIDL